MDHPTPEHSADDVRKEDLRVEVFRVPSPYRGPSIVKITHLPTGISVTSDQHSSTLQAKDQAVKMLRERLLLNDGFVSHSEGGTSKQTDGAT